MSKITFMLGSDKLTGKEREHAITVVLQRVSGNRQVGRKFLKQTVCPNLKFERFKYPILTEVSTAFGIPKLQGQQTAN